MARAKRRPPSRKHRERNHSRPRQWLEMVTTKISRQPESQGRGVARYRTEWMKPLKAVSPKPKRAAVAAPTSSWGLQSVIKYMLWFQKTRIAQGFPKYTWISSVLTVQRSLGLWGQPVTTVHIQWFSTTLPSMYNEMWFKIERRIIKEKLIAGFGDAGLQTQPWGGRGRKTLLSLPCIKINNNKPS